MEVIKRLYDVKIEEKSKGESNEFEFVGTPIVFNSLSHDLGGFREIIAPSAWQTADYSECFAVFNHKEEHLLGTYPAGTLRFTSVDNEGVHVAIDKADTTISRDCSEWVKRGEVTGMSFAFTIADGGVDYDLDDEDNITRTITKFGKIYDVSLVTRPAYPAANVRSGLSEKELQEIRQRLKPETHISKDNADINKQEEEKDDADEIEYYRFLHLNHKR